MPDLTRRGFLQILSAAAAGTAIVGPGLFAGEAQGVPLIGGFPHYVYQRGRAMGSWAPRLEGGSRASLPFMREDEGIWDFNQMSGPWGKKGWVPTTEEFSYTLHVASRAGLDPHIAFFMAAGELQDAISKDVQSIMKEYNRGHFSSGSALLTVVDIPIMAFPYPDSGYHLQADMGHVVIQDGTLLNTDTALSKVGRVPVEAPSTIEFKLLIHMVQELRQMGVLRQNSGLRELDVGKAFQAAKRGGLIQVR